jgi:uncharacterized membrane protein
MQQSVPPILREESGNRRAYGLLRRFREPANKLKKDANMDITRTSEKRISAGQREVVTAGGNQAPVRKLLKNLATVVFGMLLSVSGSVQAQYLFTTIDVPDATATRANGNSTHEIAGEFDDAARTAHGFVLNKGVFTRIDVPGAKATPVGPDTSLLTAINGINAPGQLVGTYGDGTTVHSFFWSKGNFTTLDPDPDKIRSQGGFLNAQGQVVGTYRDKGQKRHGFIWREGIFTTFNVPDDHPVFGTVAMGINDIGEIVGNFVDVTGDNVHRQGFLRSSNGTFTKFAVPGRTFTSASGINNAGQIVGFYADDDFNFHGFVLSSALAILKGEEGDYKYVDVPGAVETQINSINSKGEIVGAYFDADGKQHGFVGTPIR